MSWVIFDAVEARAARTPGAPLVVDDEGVHTLGDVLDCARAVAQGLRAAVGERPTIAVEARQDWRTMALLLAVAELDGTLALIPPGHGRGEAELALEDVDPDALVASPRATGTWTDAKSDLARLDGWRLVVFDGERGDARERWGEGVLIGLTSGSTGRAKAIVQTERSLRYAVDCMVEAVGLQEGEAIAAVTPLSSGPAICFGPYQALCTASPLVLIGRWDPAVVLRRFADNEVKYFMGVPTHVLKLAEAAPERGVDMEGARAVCVGGGPMTPAVLRAAERALNVPLLRMFGMTECLGHTVVAFDDPDEIRLETEGRPFPGTEHLVVDESGAEVPRGEVGEAFVRGPSLLLGYAEHGALKPPPLLPSGHFPTGDLVTVTDDGILKVTGRKKNQIMRAGKGIDAVEVETALSECAGVAEACVVPVPEPTLGEQAAALVVPDEGRAFDRDAVLAFLAERGMSKYKWPEHFVVCDELPKTGTGKLARAAATELARERVAEATADV